MNDDVLLDANKQVNDAAGKVFVERNQCKPNRENICFTPCFEEILLVSSVFVFAFKNS